MATFSTVAALTITTASIPDGNGRLSDGVDNSSDEYQKIHWYARMEVGSTTTGDAINFYFFHEDDHATQFVTDGETLTDSALSATPDAYFIGSMQVEVGVSNVQYYARGVVHDPGPGRWAIGFMNETGVTMSTTEADGFIHWVGEKA